MIGYSTARVFTARPSCTHLDPVRVALQQVLEQLLRLVEVAQPVLRGRRRRRHPVAARPRRRQQLQQGQQCVT